MAETVSIPKRSKRRWRKAAVGLAMVATLVVGRWIWGLAWAQITPGADTTCIEVASDGIPDYVSALDQHYRAGLTAENNAAPLLVEALGPWLIPEAYGRLQAMGAGWNSRQAEGDFFVTLQEYMQAHRPRPAGADDKLYSGDVLLSEYDLASSPWKSAEHPELAQWLEGNARALHLAREAAKRPRLFWGLVTLHGSPLLMSSVEISYGQVRDLGEALLFHAMQCAEVGDFAGTREDLLSMHRLARLVGQGPFLLEREIAMTLEQLALEDDMGLVHQGKLSAAQAKQLANDVASLPALPPVEEVWKYAERYCFLDLLVSCATRGEYETTRLIWGPNTPMPRFLTRSTRALNILPVHYNVALRNVNALFDRMVATEERPAYPQRLAARNALRAEASSPHASDPRWILLMPLARRMIECNHPYESCYAGDRFEEVAAERDLTVVALLLAAYKAEHGAYPVQLEDVAIDVHSQLPQDRFTGENLQYRLEGGQFVLYTCGINMRDDQGVGRKEWDSPEDDLAARSSGGDFGRASGEWFIRLDGFQ